jgi:serine/threonine protein kinase
MVAEVSEQFGPYKRIRRLGAGGMAEAFLAVQRAAAGFEQRVCMKFILPGYRENADFRRLFLREASIAASLRHSNIVGVIDVDAAAGYMVLELVDGVDLRALLNAAPSRRLSPEIAILVTVELCKALSYAHGRVRRGQPDGIVHRDVSPSNVLISYAGEVKLTDFGVARAMRSDVEPLSTTVKGKLCYMSPEQARGQLLDGRSDLFAVGVMCFELLSGVRPFDGNNDAETLLRVTNGQHVPLLEAAPHVSRELAQLVEKLICHDRERRFASADAVIDALARFAPPVTCFRDLGRLARAARPHETIIGEDLDPLEQINLSSSSKRLISRSLSATIALPEGGDVAHAETQGVEGRGTREATATRSETDHPVRPRIHRNAWIALATSFAALVVVTSVWLTRLPDTTAIALEPRAIEPTDHTNTVQQPPEPPPPPPPQPPPPLPDAGIDDPPQPLPTRVASPGVPATLTVGVIPTGQVWIDNHVRGYSPLRSLKLKPGRYLIGAGTTNQQVQRTVVLRSGETRKVVLSLDGDEAASGQATD